MPKRNIGTIAENFVQVIAERAFSSDFVFRSPRRAGGRELTDILILFDDTALIIQAKAQALSKTGSGYDTGLSLDWAAKHLVKAGRQVSGAVRAIKAGQVKFVENSRRGRVPFNFSDYPFLHGVILIDHESEPYEASTLVPGLRNIQVPLHVLSFRDYMLLAKVLDTPGDAVNYFESRYEVLSPSVRPMVHEENKVFGYYLARLEEITAMRSRAHGGLVTEEQVKAYADGLRQLAEGRHTAHKVGFVIDHIIDRLHDLDPEVSSCNVSGKIEPHADRTIYARIATELGKITRVRRIQYGQRYVSLAQKVAESGKPAWVKIYSQRRSFCMLLMCSPCPRSERQRRAEELAAITSLAKAYHMVHKAIGIATEPAGQMGSSYDVVLMESPPRSDERAQELGRQVFSSDNECSIS
jgi:hypothetical protein